MKPVFILSVFGIAISYAAHGQGEVTQSLPPIVIEAPKIETTVPQSSSVQVQTGFGMKEVDPPINELGIELRNMEKLTDISAERRQEGWFLSPLLYPKSWQTQCQLDVSIDQKLKALTQGAWLGLHIAAEGGFFHDHRSVTYMNNSGNPYDTSGNHLDTYPYRKDGGYLKLLVQDPSSRISWKNLADLDVRAEDIYAGPNRIGEKNQIQTSFNGDITVLKWNLNPFLQVRETDFRSRINPFLSNKTKGWKVGVQSRWQMLSEFSLLNSLSRETFVRQRGDTSSVHFNRNQAKVSFKYSSQDWKWIEFTSHLTFEVARDEVGDSRSSNGLDSLWDSGVEVSTSRRFPLGWKIKGRRFSLLPTPSQRFGDGALLEGSPHLPLETGIRFSTGPWYETQLVKLELSAFAEESKDSPIMVAVSPTSVRTLPLGGVWTRGVQLQGVLFVSSFSIKPSVSFQDAINASLINWQQGQPVPGRPRYVIQTEADYDHKGIKAGMRYSFKSEDALDLGGLWFQAPQHRVDTWVGYGKKTWEVKLLANNLLPNFSLPQNLQFQGTASPNLLEPNFQQREVRLQCEIII